MASSSKTLILLFSLLSIISLVHCAEFECPKHGTLAGKKVPNILELIEKQNGYYLTVEVNNKDRENLVHEHFNVDRQIGFIDLEAMKQYKMNRRYYYHETNEKLAVREDSCTRLTLTQTERVESVKDWFEPMNIVEDSEIFRNMTHFGPSALMLYAHSINDKALFIGTEQIDGRSIDHWFYCIDKAGPYVDFYFDAVTSYPFRFSLFYPQLVKNELNGTVQTEDNRDSDYVYNFFIFKPLVISIYEPIPYPVSYGCADGLTNDLLDFTTKPKFTLDLEAIMTYSSGQIVKTTARVMKVGEVYSYEITEAKGTVRSIENPHPLGRWEIDQSTGKCRYFTSQYTEDTKFSLDRGFTLLYYIVMKPDPIHRLEAIGSFVTGPFVIDEYKVRNFFIDKVDAIVDYHYPVVNGSIGPNHIPSKIVFTKDRTSEYMAIPNEVEVTIIDYKEDYFEYEDRFDVSECYEDVGSYTWFQIVFSNPFLSSGVNKALIRADIQDSLIDFIPITRISDIVVDSFDSNIYVTVKLLDRIHFIESYSVNKNFKLLSADQSYKHRRVEDCEEQCTMNPSCYKFNYCSDFSCNLLTDSYWGSSLDYEPNCTLYTIQSRKEVSSFMKKNFLTPSRFILHEIRRKIVNNELYISSVASSAEELFVVHGPEEIGDIYEEVVDRFGDLSRFRPGEGFPVIQPARKLSNGYATELKVDYVECMGLCANDDACNTVSFCSNSNGECILSSETSSTINSTTLKSDTCNVYEKSFLNYFTKYPGRSLVVDAASTKEGIHFTDCAKECINSKDFKCESFDYCSNGPSMNESVCFLHINHITIDTTHEVNTSNWKFTDNGCAHFAKKSDHDYRQVVAHEFNFETEVIASHDNIHLEDCANRCNGDPRGCYTFEYCETVEPVESIHVDWSLWVPASNMIKETCRLSNVKPRGSSNTNDPEFKKYFDKSLLSDRICSIYINHEKIKTNPPDELNGSVGTKDQTNLAFGLGSFFFVLAFAVGVASFTFAVKRELISF